MGYSFTWLWLLRDGDLEHELDLEDGNGNLENKLGLG